MRIDPITDPSDHRLTEVARIYAETIPANERKPVGWLGVAAGRADFRLTIATVQNRMVGFALVFCPAGAGFALLEYLAVAGDQQGRGWGSRLFENVLAEQYGRPVIVEVDAPFEQDLDAAAVRRQQFYRRHGCRLVTGLEYQLPIPGVAPPPMQLLIASPPARLQRSELQQWLRRIYTNVYAARADDPRLEQMLAGVNDPVGLD